MTYAAVIDWPHDIGASPTLFTAETLDLLVVVVARRLSQEVVAWRHSAGEEGRFVRDHPVTGAEVFTPQSARRWLSAMRDYITGTWVDFYELASVASPVTEAAELSFTVVVYEPLLADDRAPAGNPGRPE